MDQHAHPNCQTKKSDFVPFDFWWVTMRLKYRYDTVCQNLLEFLLVDILRQANFNFRVVAAKYAKTADNAGKS